MSKAECGCKIIRIHYPEPAEVACWSSAVPPGLDISFCRLHSAAGALRDAARGVVAWRNGTEGPTVLFEQGAKAFGAIREALRQAGEDV